MKQPLETEIEKMFDKAEGLLEAGFDNPADEEYVRNVRDSLGWVLGHFNNPLQDY